MEKQGNSLLDGINSISDTLFNALERAGGVYSTFKGAETLSDLQRMQAQAQASSTPLANSMAARNNAVTLLTYAGLALAALGVGMYVFKKVA